MDSWVSIDHFENKNTINPLEEEFNTSYPSSLTSYKRFGLISRIACACVPILGICFASFLESSLSKKVDRYKPEEIKNLLNLENQFKISAIVNTVLTIAGIVACVALLVISYPLNLEAMSAALVLGGLTGAFICLKAQQLYFNRKILKEDDLFIVQKLWKLN